MIGEMSRFFLPVSGPANTKGSNGSRFIRGRPTGSLDSSWDVGKTRFQPPGAIECSTPAN